MVINSNCLASRRYYLNGMIEHICYKLIAVVQSQTETIRTLTCEERQPASRIAAP